MQKHITSIIMYLVCVGDGKYDRVEFLELFDVVRSDISQFSTTTGHVHVCAL